MRSMLRHDQKSKDSSPTSNGIPLDAALFQAIPDEQAEAVNGGTLPPWPWPNQSSKIGGIKPPFEVKIVK